jgi:hypothetical protein
MAARQPVARRTPPAAHQHARLVCVALSAPNKQAALLPLSFCSSLDGASAPPSGEFTLSGASQGAVAVAPGTRRLFG